MKEKINKLDPGITQSSVDLESPSPRSHSGLAFKHNILYVYGGIVEKGSKSLTLHDFYSLGKLYILSCILLKLLDK